ncbi:hypothetical protein [Methanolobus profundi]|uniref:Uncharacterized protein n=1 Tax=Methanolobus profundi TaxID=487685 RepID=A0A1I4S0U6_9EURY|nr:hypothetical protein [Methanolobus profundi]SFM58162.1 hypothetical protein SAMN04488696_1705 [Methanolobus profundi]
MKIRMFTLVAVAIMLLSIFTITAMASDQDRDRDRDEDCTGVPEFAPRNQTRAGIGAGDSTTELTTSTYGDCDNFIDEDGDGVCDNCLGDGVCDGDGDGRNSKGDGDRDGTGPKRDGSCQN